MLFQNNTKIINNLRKIRMNTEEGILILSLEQLNKFYTDLENKCQMLQDFEDPGVGTQVLIQQFGVAQKYITQNQMFSENEKLKQIHTQSLRFLTLPYYIGFLYGRINNPRKQAIEQAKNYLQAYLNLIETFHSEEQQLFPSNVLKTWTVIKQKKDFNYPRDQVIANHKQKKAIQQRYKKNTKVKDQGDQRQVIKDFLMLKLYESVTQLKNIHEQQQILKYKATIEKDPQQKKKHEQQLQKPIPKMKVWQVKKPEQIHSCMCPPKNAGQLKKEKIAQVWQQNANQPTMTLAQVGDLQMQNMHARMERQKKFKQQNKVDTDSDKEEVDDRQKKQARAWDDWKDAHEKGAGNRGNR